MSVAQLQETAFDRILGRLDAVKLLKQGDAMARCPAHPDGSPSLHITQNDTGVAIHCFAGCEPRAITAALDLRMADLFDRGQATTRTLTATRKAATYTYTDENGIVLYRKNRSESKAFWFERPDVNGAWIKGIADTRRVLYNLPDVLAAAEGGDTIYVVEGEKDADALARAGQVATTNDDGAAAMWKADYSESLRGARVIVIADDDEPGHKHAHHVAKALQGIAATVDVRLPAAGHKDIADHLGAGLDLEQLRELTSATQSEPDPCAELTPRAMNIVLSVRTTAEILAMPPPEFLVDGWVVANSLNCIYGKPATFKSLVAQSMALALATGVDWYGRLITSSRVLYVAAEGAGGLGKRIASWCEDHAIPSSDLAGLKWLPMAVNLLDDELAAGLVAAAEEYRSDVVFIDTVARSVPGAAENDSVPFSKLVAVADRLRAQGRTVVLVHHTPKSGEGMRGHGVLEGAVDTAIEAKREIGSPLMTLTMTKQKDFGEEEPVTFRLRMVGDSVVLDHETGNGSVPVAEAQLLAVLRQHAGSEGLTPKQVMAIAEMAPRSYYRAMKVLRAREDVLNVGTDTRPRLVPAVDTDDADTANTANDCQLPPDGDCHAPGL